MAEEIKNPTPAPESDAEDDVVVLEDEEGNVIRFQFLEMVETNGKPYAILMPLEDAEDEDGVVIVEIVDLGLETEHYDAVTDESLLDQIFEQFRTEFADQYEFE